MSIHCGMCGDTRQQNGLPCPQCDKLAEAERAIDNLLSMAAFRGRDQTLMRELMRERLLPAISRLLDAAHADALRAAAELCEPYMSANTHYLPVRRLFGQLMNKILALIPERARLERELEVARAVREEASRWTDGANLLPHDGRIADLDARLAALQK